MHRLVMFRQLSSTTLNIPNVSPLLAARFRVPEDIAAAVTAGAEKAEPPAGGNRKRTPGTCDAIDLEISHGLAFPTARGAMICFAKQALWPIRFISQGQGLRIQRFTHFAPNPTQYPR